MKKKKKRKSKTNQLPRNIRAYQFHGVDLGGKDDGRQIACNCLFCDREGKMSIVKDTGQFRCVVCQESGNTVTFLRALHEMSMENTSEADYKQLARDRGLITTSILKKWGVCKSVLNGNWLVPGGNFNGKLVNLYRWAKIEGKYKLLSSPALPPGIFGYDDYDFDCETAFFLEGWGNGLALAELLKKMKEPASVLSSPGATVFNDGWGEFFRGKDVVICCDNDHPRKNVKTKKTIEGAGLSGVKKAASIIKQAGPASMRYNSWGKAGFNKNIDHGFDIRDLLTKGIEYAN